MLFTLLLFLHKKKENHPVFILEWVNPQFPVALAPGFSYVGTVPWPMDCWSLPPPYYHARQLGLICLNSYIYGVSVWS